LTTEEALDEERPFWAHDLCNFFDSLATMLSENACCLVSRYEKQVEVWIRPHVVLK
jgi:hypothetical protein